jgi:hypothetical protein
MYLPKTTVTQNAKHAAINMFRPVDLRSIRSDV